MATDAQSSFYVDGEGLQSTLPTGEANQEAQSSFYSNEGGGTATYASITDLVTRAETAATEAEAAAASVEDVSADAAAAAASAAAALVSETNAAASEAAAATSASNAATSETNAAASEAAAEAALDSFDDRYLGAKASDPALDNDGNALLTGALYFNTTTNDMKMYTGSAWKDLAADAETAQTAAEAAQTAAETAQTNAETAETNAETAETNAASSASAASTSASNAATSASNAATSETNAAASYDAFDDRYLGSKSSDPTLDNDGNALLTGALYWNTSTNLMRVYNGSTWADVTTGQASNVSTGSGAPVTTPSAEGDIYVDTTNDNVYMAKGTASSADWVQVNGAGSGTVDTFGTPVANDFARFTDADTIEGRSYAETRTDLGLVIGTDVQAYSAVLAATTASFTTADETKLDGIEALADVTDATNVAAAGAVMESDTSTALMSFVVDEDAMTSNSATKVPTQQSVKAYVDANAGTGDVTKVGTPVDGQLGVWTGDGTIEGDADLTFDSTTDILKFDSTTTTTAGIIGSSNTGQLNIGAHTTTTSATSGPILSLYGDIHGTYPGYAVLWTSNTTYGWYAEGNNTSVPGILTAGSISTAGTVDGRDVSVDGAKLDGIASGADVTDATSVAAAGAVMESDTSTALMGFVIDEDLMTSNSATKVPTQQSVKAYVDANAGGGGDVTKVGTPVDNQIGVWTGDGTIEGDTALTFDTTTNKLTVGVSSSTASITISPGVGQSGILTLHGAGVGYTVEADGSSKAGSANDFRVTNGTNGDIWEYDHSNLWQSFKGRVRHGESTAATGINAPKIETGSAVPATTPDVEGDIFVDTTNDNIYMAKGSASSADWVQVNGSSGPSVSTGSGAPVSTPGAEGDIYIDTTNDYAYMATGTASSADWDLLTVAGDNTVWIPAAAFSMYESASVPELTGEATTSNPRGWQYLGFDATTEEEAEFTLVYPDGWDNGTVTAEIYWYENSAGGTGGVVFGLIGTSYADLDLSDGADGTQVTVTDNASNLNNTIHITPETSAITIGGSPAAGHLCHFAVSREVANVSDTYVLDASIIGIKLIYTENKPNDN